MRDHQTASIVSPNIKWQGIHGVNAPHAVGIEHETGSLLRFGIRGHVGGNPLDCLALAAFAIEAYTITQVEKKWLSDHFALASVLLKIERLVCPEPENCCIANPLETGNPGTPARLSR
jgi:hypothetical protein